MTEEPRDPNAQQPPAPEEPAAPAAEADDAAADGRRRRRGRRLAGEPGDEPRPRAGPEPLPHRLTRSRQERVFGGIAGGVADYFDIDPVLVRIAFVILAIVTRGAFVLLYFAAWIIIPEEAPSTASAGATGEAATPAAPRRRHEHRRHEGVGTGAIVVGVLLILLGAASLMWTLGLRTPPIDAVLAGLLILVGLAILVESRRGVHGGLVVIALILTGILGTAATTVPGVPLRQRIRRAERAPGGQRRSAVELLARVRRPDRRPPQRRAARGRHEASTSPSPSGASRCSSPPASACAFGARPCSAAPTRSVASTQG